MSICATLSHRATSQFYYERSTFTLLNARRATISTVLALPLIGPFEHEYFVALAPPRDAYSARLSAQTD